ncbi:phosphate starvation-inducible protein PhoH [Candidatus Nitrosoglobus terrae]|uniref:PhoH-like protein n=1 Tax=Candidatus Nitrosoglobus terrae TaxID=1630141 RepID=A0A1Q2SPT6_9GAMM|nr:PhoH family protein [Candidatus Nitrosoglobus terrae]BAW81148.1 phosphate starvation-inducible protein PhoH [Candidatus Nitrosoglobus terrae]
MNRRSPSDYSESNEFALEPFDNQRLANLCGQSDEHLRQIEKNLAVSISNRGNCFRIIGSHHSVQTATKVIRCLYDENNITLAHVHLLLQAADRSEYTTTVGDQKEVLIRTRKGMIKGRGLRQICYLRHIFTHDISFGIGPAGTGKTYLAVACAVEALEKDRVRRLLLIRPAVEAGERLGFLPGDLVQKIDPYLRPLYDSLYEMLGFERVTKLMERHVIEVAPLAYMRGRTLNESFIILDEAQNTTPEQMKMFLTRLGYGSTAVITGDITQVDLPKGQYSGLRHAIEVLKDIQGISFTFFESCDVVRHPLVQRVVQAYERFGSDDRRKL